MLHKVLNKFAPYIKEHYKTKQFRKESTRELFWGKGWGGAKELLNFSEEQVSAVKLVNSQHFGFFSQRSREVIY